MKKKLMSANIILIFIFFYFPTMEIYSDIKTNEIKILKDEQKKDEIMLEGKIIQNEKSFYLKTLNEEIFLPMPKKKKKSIKLEEFVDKTVILTAKGSTINHDNLGSIIADKHLITKILKIQLVLKEKINNNENK
jgi:hypothetical protein